MIAALILAALAAAPLSSDRDSPAQTQGAPPAGGAAAPPVAPAPPASAEPAPAQPSPSPASGLTELVPPPGSAGIAISAADEEALRRLAQSGAPASLPPVTARMFSVTGRLEVSPMFAFSVGDPFFRSAMLGVRAEQHLSESWSLGGHLFGGTSLVAAPIDLCGGGPCSAPVAAQLRSTPGNLQAAFGLEASYRPLYGKLSLLGEKTLHFDLYLSLGPELLRERIAPDAASAESTRWDLGGRASIGERIYFSNRFSLRLGASELLFGSRVRGRVEIERKLMIETGLAFFFGGQ
jgi:outer membrane beta-barrel protein